MNSTHNAIAQKRQSSPLWELFMRVGPGLAKCLLCRRVLSFKSCSISNLKRHLRRQHDGAFEKIKSSVTCLIELVEKHPCLWDTRCESYGNVDLQHKAWNTIATKLCPTEDQSEVVTRLSEQFNGLRNRYFSRRSSYSEHLSFMAPLLDEYSKTKSLDKEICGTEVKHGEQPASTLNIVKLVPKEKNVSNGQCSTKGNGNDNLHVRHHKQNSTKVAANANVALNGECSSNPTLKIVSEKQSKSEMFVEIPAAAQVKCNLQLNSADDDPLFLISLADEIKMVPKQFQVSFKADLLSTFSELLQKYENGNLS